MFLAVVLFGMVLSQAGAHDIAQVLMRLNLEEEEWHGRTELDALMLLEIDAGGDVDEDGTNEWFASLSAEEARAFFVLTEKYWRERFLLTVGGEPCPYEISLPDPLLLQKDVAGSPVEGILINLTVKGTFPGKGGTVEVTWRDAAGPYLVIAVLTPESENGTHVQPVEHGEPVALAKRRKPEGAEVDAKVVTEVEPPSLWGWIEYGFVHIVPKGLDHILFVVGLFLLVPRWKPLLLQSAAFTVAHSLTLALVVLGVFTVPAEVVEPLIALSIAYVAIENLFVKELKAWRVGLVFGLGLLHGMGFAGVMQELDIPEGQIVRPLLGFNLGVELGQVAVLAVAFLATCWCLKNEAVWKRVRFWGSLIIAAVGLFWTVQRMLG